MGLAIIWLCQGMFILGTVHAGRSLLDYWSSALNKVMMYPGSAAIGAWFALQSFPVALLIAAAGAIALMVGLAAIGSFMVTMAVLMAFGAACMVGLLMPNLGVEHSPRN
jgi:hypothetical protein